MWEFAIFVIVFIVVSIIGKAKQQSQRPNGQPSPRVQKLIERMQAQQGGMTPTQFQGQYTRPAGRQPQVPGAPNAPLTYSPAMQYQPSIQYNQQQQYQQPQYQQPPAHRPQQNHLPTTNQDLEARVRDLMKSGNEVGAVRLLSEERGLGILEGQQYARSLVAPPANSPAGSSSDAPEPDEDDSRYVGSAAFAESIFTLDDREENVWASGWVDKPEPDDRSDIDELWQTVRNPPRPGQAS